MHPRLKSWDDRFAATPQYILYALDWIERNAVASSAERKQFQSEINVGQLVNFDNGRRMILDDQIFSSFKNIKETHQYFHNMLLNVLANIKLGSYILAKFNLTEIIQTVAGQYGELLTDEQVNAMD